MTDHKEEQNNEIEALESIYPDELEGLEILDFGSSMHLFRTINRRRVSYLHFSHV